MPAYLDYAGNGSVQPGGHFRLALATGATTGLTANQAFLCFRWTDPTHWLVLLQMKIQANINTAFGTAQLTDAALWFNRQWSTAASGGTTVVPLKSFENMVRDNGAQPGFNQMMSFSPNIQISTTGALTTGSRVQDTNPLAYSMFGSSNALGNSAESEIVRTDFGFQYPLLFAQNEGFELTVPTAQGATGKVTMYVSMILAVVNAY